MIRVEFKDFYIYDNIDNLVPAGSAIIDNTIICKAFFASSLLEYSIFIIDPKNKNIISNSVFIGVGLVPSEFIIQRAEISIKNKYLYISIDDLYFDCFFIGNINNPIYIGRIEPGTPGEHFYRFFLDDSNKIFFSSNTHISVFDVTNPSLPVQTEYFAIPFDYYGDMSYYNNKIYLIASYSINIYDVSGAINLIDSIVMDDYGSNRISSIVEGLLIVSDEFDSTIKIFDIDDPEHKILSTLNFSFGWINSFCKFSDSFVFFTVWDYTTGDTVIYCLNTKDMSLYVVDFEYLKQFNGEIFVNKNGSSFFITTNISLGGPVLILMDLNVDGLSIKANGVPRITNFARYLTFGKGELN